jgi:ABC-2 type transport system permease protein
VKNAVRNEFRKLLYHKKYIVLLIIGTLLGLAWSLLGRVVYTTVSTVIGWNLSGVDFNTVPTTSLSFFAQFYLPLMIFMAVTDLFSAEYSDQTIKFSLMRPITRLKLYTAKIAAILVYCAGFLAVVLAVTLAAGIIVGGVDSFGVAFRSLLGFVVTLVPLGVLCCYAALIAQFIKSGSLLMFALIFSVIMLTVVPILFPISPDVLFTGHLGWYTLFTGVMPGFWRTVNIVAVLLSSGAVFYLGGTMLFDRKDF